MNWFKNLKIKKKLMIAFTTVFILFFVQSIGCVYLLCAEAIKYNKSVDRSIELITKSTTISNNFGQLVNLSRDLILFSSNENKLKELNDKIMPIQARISVAINKYADLTKDGEEEQIANVKELKALNSQYLTAISNIIGLLNEGNYDDALQLLNDSAPVGTAVLNLAESINNDAQESLRVNSANFNETLKEVIILMIVLITVITIITFIFSNYISNTVKNPILFIEKALKEILDGNLDVAIRSNHKDEVGSLSNSIADVSDNIKNLIGDINKMSAELDEGDIDARINAENYNGAFAKAATAINTSITDLINEQFDLVNCVKEYANGNFDLVYKDLPGKKVVFKEALDLVRANLKEFSDDINILIKASVNGELNQRIDANTYKGDWKTLASGLNQLLEAIVLPINDISLILESISKGDFSARVTNVYNGDFNRIIVNLNETTDTITSYLTEISDVLTEMSKQNLDVEISREYIGDYKVIKDSILLIINSFNKLIGEINLSTDQVSAGAKQISLTSLNLSQGAVEQASAVEELNSTLSIIAQKSEENAGNSERANKIAISTMDSAVKGSEHMNSMVTAMKEINESSNSISNIIMVIDDIAFQTNILALNAAVEAARAGSHGKGFAVVADEVRNLAARSQVAAKETTKLIQNSVNKAIEGSAISDKTAKALQQIVSQVKEISDLVNNSEQSSKEQQISISQVAVGVNQISQVAQNNTATSEESAASAEELSNQAEMLSHTVSKFKLKNFAEKNNSPFGTSQSSFDKPNNKLLKDINEINLMSNVQSQDFGKY